MNQGYIITIDIGASKIRGQVFELCGNFSPIYSIKLTGKDLDNDSFLELVKDCIYVNDKTKPMFRGRLLAISVGSPGPLDPLKGIIEEAPNLRGVKGLNIVDVLTNEFKVPVFLLNDADAAGLGEYWRGSGTDCSSSMIYITLSSGVGSAYLINGELQRGLGKAPELGHISLAVENDFRFCSCGSWGCSEAYLGTKGLALTYAEIFGNKDDDLSLEVQHSISPQMREGVRINDKKWTEVQDAYTCHLAIFLRNIILAYQPENIILGGGIIFDNNSLLQTALDKLNALDDKMMVMKNGVNIRLAKFENAVNLGAAKYAISRLGQEGRG
ncbi:MAG: ROK family protein [Candidatus Yanofskybacteria bacterium]|nr:ROK family protein [Candidatus Yanofskybacteria bacterium]